ncbi:unnamed protein product, partial [Hymenolepis diminuta]
MLSNSFKADITLGAEVIGRYHGVTVIVDSGMEWNGIQTRELANELSDGWRSGWMDGWRGGWMEGWRGGWM